MIVGKGDIASVLNDREGATFFVSGVSNSNETRESEFMREIELLDKQDRSKCLFYFSSIAIDDLSKNSQYLQHKRRMELLIKSNFENYNIIRIGNITWGSNPNTFINYIRPRAGVRPRSLHVGCGNWCVDIYVNIYCRKQ